MGSLVEDASAEPLVLPSLVDRLAIEDPKRVICWSPKGSRYSDGCETVTIADLARAINRAAHWFEESLGKSSNFETLAYMGPSDARYMIMILASVKAGYRLLLLSLRNSVTNHLSVLDATKCTTLLHAHSVSVQNILDERGTFKAVEVPELAWLLDPSPVEDYSYTKTFQQAEWEPLLILHSSGSTGPPKPIIYTHGSAETIRAQLLPATDPKWTPWLQSIKAGTKAFCPMPFFHAAGVFNVFFMCLYQSIPFLHPPPGAAINVALVQDAVENMAVDYALLPPSLLEDMSKQESSLAILEKVPLVGYGGGPISEAAGDIIHTHTFLLNVIGSTESGIFPVSQQESSGDYAWLRFKPGLSEIEFRDRGEGMFELVFVRDPKVKTRLHSSWYAFPDQDEYPTKDLYIKHPTREGLWKHVARTDDVIVLSNGEKVVSIPIEDALHEASEIQAVVVLGHGRFQVAALVEPTQEARKQMSEKELMKKIMPYIRKANGLVPGHARLTADHVLFTDPERPMIRTPKGTVVRKATLALYKNDVDKLYTEGTQDDSSGELSGIKLFEGEDIKKTEKSLHDIIAHVTEAKDIEADQDLFAAGVDSLQVLSLVKLLKAKVKAEMPAVEVDKAVTPALVYASPTVKELAKALIALSDPESGKNQEQAHHRAMEEMLDKYSQGIPTAGEEVVVLLTGSTGSLGCYLLDELVSRDRISRVYALNRADDGLAKQTEASGSRGLSTDFRDKVVFLHADLARERLGLDAADYAAMQTAVTFVIHNAWPVNFNQTLPSFEPHVRGTRHLIDFSAAAVHRPPILFTSTMATAQNWRAVHPGDRVPERLIGDMRVPAPMGYAESKYVAEHLLAGAANLGVSAAICHVGQVAGPVGKPGVWNKQEWFPSIVASSKYLNLIPSSLGGQQTVDWVPVDLMASIILELCKFDHWEQPIPAGAAWTLVHNLVNPTDAPWRSGMRVLQRHFLDAKVVEYDEWLAALKKSAEGADADPVANPGIKLLDFYEGLRGGGVAKLETRETAKRSRTMREMSGVGEEWVERWMGQWGL